MIETFFNTYLRPKNYFSKEEVQEQIKIKKIYKIVSKQIIKCLKTNDGAWRVQTNKQLKYRF